ncbi:hypothetical protein GCM10022212_27530 [Actimicrobium antarcticum]|uniref:Uncharacterized protein n=1 Tax=Actimicrobium antarcticum TaxID=1051899 RepID=A0ABP7TL22_9BURK
MDTPNWPASGVASSFSMLANRRWGKDESGQVIYPLGLDCVKEQANFVVFVLRLFLQWQTAD